MKENKTIHAVIIGFNHFKDPTRLPNLEFAEKDAYDLYDLLIDPRYGDCPIENITLVTSDEIRLSIEEGKNYDERIISFVKRERSMSEFTTQDLKNILYTQAVTNRNKNETVLVYYSGHGFKTGKDNFNYLATIDISHFDIHNKPEAGLQMEFIHNTIFKDTQVKCILVLLDCCYSGAIIDGNQSQLIELKDYSLSDKLAIVSSPKDIISRESKEYKNGIFTHFLLEGLMGVDPEINGEVTITSLFAYLHRMCPTTQTPILYGQLTTRIVLTKPNKIFSQKNISYNIVPQGQLRNLKPSLQIGDKFQPLQNPLDIQIEYAEIIKKCVLDDNQQETLPVGNKILTAIRCSLGAEFAVLLRIEENGSEKNVIYKYESNLSINGYDLIQYKKLILEEIYNQLIKKKNDLLISRYGYIKQFEGRKDSSKYIIIIPLHLIYPREFMVLSGVDSDNLKYGEIIGRVLTSVYDSTHEFSSIPLSNIESSILDDIKRDFGHVPYSIYQRRYELFNEKLKTINFAFEPVVKINKRRPEIHSWEALARDPLSHKAPVSLFNSAELWGPQFITQLDLYCLENSIKRYLELWRENHDKGQIESPLAINVYPDSIFRDAYKSKIRELLDSTDISEERLIFEISEKRPIPSFDRISERQWEYKNPVDAFVGKIHEYIKDLGVRFAIDDFGVGHSSISRMYQLNLSYIKIDRDIILHTHPGLTIDYVKNFVHAIQPTRPAHIVVEGFDNDSQITLNDLYAQKIVYIQGHMIRRATASLEELSDDEKNFIKRELQEEIYPKD